MAVADLESKPELTTNPNCGRETWHLDLATDRRYDLFLASISQGKKVRLRDHVAVVTGADNAIGKRLRLALAVDGAQAVVVDVQTATGEETA